MLQKTEMSQASTNIENKPTSVITSRNRQMYRIIKKNEVIPKNIIVHQISNDRLPNDLLHFEPTLINNLAFPLTYYLENDIRACVKDNFYEISGLRGKKRFFSRDSQQKSELIYFFAEKLTKKINLITIQRYLTYKNNKQQLCYHLNLTKFQPQTHQVYFQNYYIEGEQNIEKNSKTKSILDFSFFKLIQNSKKGVIFFKILPTQSQITSSQYKIMLIDLQQKKKSTKLKQEGLIILANIEFDTNKLGRQNQYIIKIIKSQFGDIILIITNREIYQLQIQDINDGFKMHLKPYKMEKIINKKDIVLNKTSEKQFNKNTSKVQYASDHADQLIKDAEFLSNGLKIIILTSLNQIIVIDSHNYLFSQKIDNIILNSTLLNKYCFEDFVYTNIYSSNGSICLEFKSQTGNDLLLPIQGTVLDKSSSSQITMGLILLKIQNNSFSLNKLISYPFKSKQLIYHNISQCPGVDEILIQYIQKQDLYKLNILKCKLLISQINSFVKLSQQEYNYSLFINKVNNKQLTQFHINQEQKIYYACSKAQTSRFIYLLNAKQLTCYKLFNQMVSQKIEKQENKLFTHTFFEKPIKISVSPITMHFVIVFKEFVKFFYFNYTTIKNYFTLKIKNIVDAQYVLNGSKIMIATCQGEVSLIDAYSFIQQKILEVYGEIIDIKMTDQNHLILKSNKNILCLYQRKQRQDNELRQFVKKYEVKIEDGDKYQLDHEKLLIVRKNFQIQVYQHDPPAIPQYLPQLQRQIYQKLHQNHKHLSNKKDGYTTPINEVPCNILISNQLGFLFITTNKGNIREYIWPLQQATNFNQPQMFIQQISSQQILSIFIDARFNHLYAISKNGTVTQLKITQYINSQLMPYVYIFNQKTVHLQKQKREFTDKSYFIDDYTPTELTIIQNSQQNIDELLFLIDKLKDDIQQMMKNSLNKGKQESTKVKSQIKTKQSDLQQQIQKNKKQYMQKMNIFKQQQELSQKQFTLQLTKQQQNYHKQLLKIYKQSNRLKQILKNQDQKLTAQKRQFIQIFKQKIQKLNKQKDQQLIKLQDQYKQIQERKSKVQRQNNQEQKQEQIQMQQYKKIIHELIQNQCTHQQQTKQRFLGENSKKQKGINNLKHRNNYFQNLILQTKVQITQLLKDQVQYDSKKKYLKEQLRDKQQLIQKIQKQLVIYLKNTEDMKTIKNNHQFQLEEYQKQVNPIQDNYKHLEENVKNMNVEIMLEYNHKVNKIDSIDNKLLYISKLKEKKKNCIDKKLQKQNKFNRLAQKMTFLAEHAFDVDLKGQLLGMFENNQKSDALIKLDQDKQKQKRAGEKLMRYKNMIIKQIEQQQKRQEHIVKNQHEFYRYHNQNTTLVRQFNELKKRQKVLADQQSKLQEKLALLKNIRLNTPLKRIPSRSLNNQIDKKMTPFQKYEEMNSLHLKKIQDTSDTRLSKNSQSLSFLKGLLKEVNQTDNKYQKMELMKERVRTFVNPQFKARPQQIKKMLFSRTRGTSQMLKLK